MADAEKMTNECLLNESLRQMCFIPQWECQFGGVVGKARCPQSLCEMLQLVSGGPAIMNAGSSPGTVVECRGAHVEGPAMQLGQECPQRHTETSKI
jgi:hypothetical protein